MKFVDLLPQSLRLLVHASQPTGSSYICEPPVLNTDRDFVVLVSNIAEFNAKAKEEGFVFCGDEEYEAQSEWSAVRKGMLNLIVVQTKQLYEKWYAATALAKRLNLVSKDDRVALFEVVVDDNYAYI